ncbi:hypothetical protein [Bacillus massiliglaciei]|uniref:hypothetical protein n=1 Tax=Bacillus massiliglaciei TaxID=1816693 RepID=UPI000DA6170D|nr:hypothetical protein [Bacillus massiliglaciei]
MEIKLTEKQYKKLVELMQYGIWISSEAENEEAVQEAYELEQAVFSQGEERAEEISYNEETGTFDLSSQKEQEIQQLLARYEEMVFIDKLAYYLARKEAETTAESDEEAFEKLISLEEKYHSELAANGLRHLHYLKK